LNERQPRIALETAVVSTDLYITQVSESTVSRAPYTGVESVRSGRSVRHAVSTIRHSSTVYHLSTWSACGAKRIFDLLCVIPALLLGFPVLLLVALAVRCSSQGPVIFRQQRAGRYGRLFTIYKFRTMTADAERCGPSHTAKDDPRITPVGKFLRRWKLDELPQLFNVLRGDMSLVGPRPKLPDHDRTVLPCRPGITGAATLAFRNEQGILSAIATEHIEPFYQQHVAPLKLHLDSKYMASATLFSDLRVLCMTLLRAGHRFTRQDLETAGDELRISEDRWYQHV
jgi:lipopolysaccharide/colanic/teichoic acid biosynthesis glycosyltransferase